MNILDAVQQTTRRAGGGHTRQRGTEEFERATRDWRNVERPERLLSRMEQLGLHEDAVTLAQSLSSGNGLIGFNPLERIIGQDQLMSSFFLTLGAECTRAVGRIVTRTGVGVGTGFLISKRLLMTNHHVIENEKIAALSLIEFDYVRRFDTGFGATQLFRLLPGEFFLTSVTHDDLNLDYTIVAVEPVGSQGEELAGRGFISLVSRRADMTVLEWANIIQHPGGEPQQVALRDNKVVKSLDHFIHYEADTQPGSSGSPVFNDQWQLVALHHSGVPDEVRPKVYRLRNGDEWDARLLLPHPQQLRMWAKVNWISNEGVRISSIIADARSRLGYEPARHALFNEAAGENASPLLEGTGGAASIVGVVTREKMIKNLEEYYEFERELGRGSFGVTYLAHDRKIHSRCVVIKFLLDPAGGSFNDQSFRRMFESETKALARIEHPYVVDIYDYGWSAEGKPFLVMQYVEGKTLRGGLSGQAMELKRAANIVSQLGSALSAVHRAGVVHRDLKPENVMLQSTSYGEEWDEEFAILIDFGIAKLEDSRVGQSEQETVAGTLSYMAPEQLRGHPVPASDVWALGVVAYEMVTGRRPFSKVDVFRLKDVPVAPVEPRDLCPALPKVAQAIILKALSYDAADRYRHPHEMGEVFLQAVREGDPPDPDSTPDSAQSDSGNLTELFLRCLELFKLFDEFRNPESLRAFLSRAELRNCQNCVAFAARLELDLLLDCLYGSGRDYRGQALVDLLSVLGAHYRDDYRGKQCEQLRDSLKRRLEHAPAAGR
jgi:serine/threonine protein kinase/V8-like Glu-specific endopeptidase